MPKTLDHIIDEAEFEKHHKAKVSPRSQKDLFFVWTLVMIISVVGAFFLLNFTPTITGLATADGGAADIGTGYLYSVLALFVTILITATAYILITKDDY